MASKNLYYTVKGKGLTEKEKRIYDLVNAKVTANELITQTPDLTIQSVRATLARLEKTHQILRMSKTIANNKAISQYEKVE